jgi:hypothetical protein
MNFPMEPVLERYASDYLASLEDAKTLERELKRYLILCALYPNQRYVMGGPVDDLWHTFLLFTQLYVEFCEQVAGRFIHHVPADPYDGPAKLLKWEREYATFLCDYQRVFEEPPPTSIWPALETPPPFRKEASADRGQSTTLTRKRSASF